jgi:hypothetical protein
MASVLFRGRRRRRFGGWDTDDRGADGPCLELRATRSLKFEYAEALRACGAEDSVFFGAKGSRSSKCWRLMGALWRRGSLGSRCSRLFGALGVASLGTRCWGPSGFLAPRNQGGDSRSFLGPWVSKLRSRGVAVFRDGWCRGSWVDVSKTLSGLGCFEFRRVMVWSVARGRAVSWVLRSLGSVGSVRAATAWLEKRYPGRLGSSCRSVVSETRSPDS